MKTVWLVQWGRFERYSDSYEELDSVWTTALAARLRARELQKEKHEDDGDVTIATTIYQIVIDTPDGVRRVKR